MNYIICNDVFFFPVSLSSLMTAMCSELFSGEIVCTQFLFGERLPGEILPALCNKLMPGEPSHPKLVW